MLKNLVVPFSAPVSIAGRLSAVALLLSSVSAWAAEPLRVQADAVPHAELLAHGDIDANYFQHVPYLLSQEKALKVKFVVAAQVHIEPLGVYSSRHKSYADVPQNGTVAVPNNETNLSRALYLLQSQGLITLKAGFNDPAKNQATPRDIATNPKNLKILEVESPQIPRSLPDVDLAVINGNFALEAGLSPAKDALGLEKAQGNPYANILVTTEKLQNDPRIKQLAKDLQSPQVAQFISETFKGSVLPVTAAKS